MGGVLRGIPHIFKGQMAYLILALIVGLPFSPLLFHKLDIWHAIGFYAQIVIWFGFGMLLFGAAKQRFINNIPLFLLFCYAGISTAIVCHAHMEAGKYNTATFLVFFNFITILLLYYLLTYYLRKSEVCRVISALQYIVIFNALYCTLQLYGLAQFTQLKFPMSLTSGQPHSQVIGFVGNGTYLSAFIGMMFPLLFINTSRRNILAAILCVLLLTQCGEVAGDPAVVGFGILFVYSIVAAFKKPKFLFFTALVVAIALFLLFRNHNFFGVNGRTEVWKNAFEYIQYHFPMTGSGLGAMNLIAAKYQEQFGLWRHLHQEFLQVVLELGIIGLILTLNVIFEFFKTRSLSNTEFCLKLSFLGFLLSCCLLSSSHQWFMTVYATVIYSLFKVINEDNKWQPLPEKN
jgi:O-antigen ligase